MTVIDYMIDKLMVVFTTIKPVGAIAIACIAFFAPISGIVHGILLLVLFDLLSGIGADFSRKNVKFNPFKKVFYKTITSRGLGKTIEKTVIYLILLISGFIIDTLVIPNANLTTTKLLAGAGGLRELKSLVENAEIILKGGIISFIRLILEKGPKAAFNHVVAGKPMDEYQAKKEQEQKQNENK